jgi:hypothetical protein
MRSRAFRLFCLLLLNSCASQKVRTVAPFESCGASKFLKNTFACVDAQKTSTFLDWQSFIKERLVCIPTDTLKELLEDLQN